MRILTKTVYNDNHFDAIVESNFGRTFTRGQKVYVNNEKYTIVYSRYLNYDVANEFPRYDLTFHKDIKDTVQDFSRFDDFLGSSILDVVRTSPKQIKFFMCDNKTFIFNYQNEDDCLNDYKKIRNRWGVTNVY